MDRRADSAPLLADTAGLPDALILAARTGSRWRHATPDAPIAPDERLQIREALAQLDADEQFVLTHTFGLDGSAQLTQSAIWRARGWTSNRTRDVLQRALRRLAERVYVPALPAIGMWVRMGTGGRARNPAPGTPLRVIRHNDRYTVTAATSVPYQARDGNTIVSAGHASIGDEIALILRLDEMTAMPAAEAIPAALAIPEPFNRADALIGLVPYLATPERYVVLSAAAAAVLDIDKPARRYALTRCLALFAEIPMEVLAPAALSLIDYLAYAMFDEEVVPFIVLLRTRVPAAYQQLRDQLSAAPSSTWRERHLHQLTDVVQDVDIAQEWRTCRSLAITHGASATLATLGILRGAPST